MYKTLHISYETVLGQKKGMTLKGESCAHLNEQYLNFHSFIQYVEDCKDIASFIKKDAKKGNRPSLWVLICEDGGKDEHWHAVKYDEQNNEVTLSLVTDEGEEETMIISLKNMAMQLLLQAEIRAL